MSDLASFLVARIAEDEAVAKAAALHGPEWDDGGPGAIQDARTVVASDGALAHSGRGVAEAEQHALPHIVRWDPARVLAECQAKRQLLESPYDFEDVLKYLALPYADHPDYDRKWAL